MNKLKKALLGTTIAGSLVIGAGIGTYSWFTAEKTATGNIVNGTFGLGDMGTLFDQQKFAPSQLIYSDWQLVENTGNLDQLLRATYTHSVNSANATVKKYKVGYLALKFKQKPTEDQLIAYKQKLGALFNGTYNDVTPRLKAAVGNNVEVEQGILSDDQVKSLMSSRAQGQGDNMTRTITLGDGTKFWSLKEGQYIDIMFGVKLSENAGNEFQGVGYTGSFKVEAKQTDEGAQYQADIDTVNKK
jgi:spore coat-associated protein N